MDKVIDEATQAEIANLAVLRNYGVKVGSGGFVKYVDHLGSDESIVQTARVSTGRGFVSWDPYRRCKNCAKEGRVEPISDYNDDDGCMFCIWVSGAPDVRKVEHFPNGDRGIINNLVRERHTSPIEFGEIIYHLRIPMDIWRQVGRHRTANVSEYSTRYSEAIDEMATTKPNEWRLQATQNRQGSSGFLDEAPGSMLTEHEAAFQRTARQVYEQRLAFGVAKEQARKDLPLSNYTEVYWKIDTHNLMHFLGLRLEEHAQKEARDFGEGIVAIFKLLFPRLHWAFEEYKLFAVTFSRTEMEILKQIVLRSADGAGSFHSFNVQGHPLYGPENKAARERFIKKFGVSNG